MIEFVPDRRYVFINNVGMHIGVFAGRESNAMLLFRDVTTISTVTTNSLMHVEASKILDAEPWLQSRIPQDDYVISAPEQANEIAKEIKNRKAVVIGRATPGRDW